VPARAQAVGRQFHRPGADLVHDDPHPRRKRRVGDSRREFAADPPFGEKATEPAAYWAGRDFAAQPVQGACEAASEEIRLSDEDGPAILGAPPAQGLAEGVQRMRRRIAVRTGHDPRCLTGDSDGAVACHRPEAAVRNALRRPQRQSRAGLGLRVGRRHQPEVRATCPRHTRDGLKARRPGLVRVRRTPDHRGDLRGRQTRIDYRFPDGSSVGVRCQHDPLIGRYVRHCLGRASDPCQSPPALLRDAEEARRWSAGRRRGEQPEAEVRIDIFEEARREVGTVGDDRTSDPPRAVDAASKLAPADRAIRAPRLAAGSPKRRTHQCLDGRRRKAQRQAVAPARRLGVEPRLRGLGRQVGRKPLPGLRESEGQVGEQPGRVVVLERLWEARQPPARRPLGDGGT
jgi:hypothetical protein